MAAARVFVDSSAFIALFNQKEQYHPAAVRTYQSLLKKKTLYTSDYVLDEVVTFSNARYGHDIACKASDAIATSTLLSLLVIDRPVIDKAITRFKETSVKGVSFTDICSVVLMDNYKIAEIFTYDDDFNKLGYNLCR